jgi:amidase
MTSRSPSSVEMTTSSLDRIDSVDAIGTATALNSVLAVAADAMGVAAALDAERSAGRIRGPLHGLPVLVKDNIEAVGLPATAGSLALADRTVTRDSTVVARLRAAGCVIVGSTNLSEWANFRSPHSTSGWSAVGGLTANPWALDRSAGGSSAGSGAAVAAALVPVAIGTETNGSITCPASLNGVVGLKPTVGSVPGLGIVPLSADQDVAGPLARTVREAARVYEVMSGRIDCVPSCTPEAAGTVHVGVAGAWLTGHGATDALFERALALLAPQVASLRDATARAADGQVHDDQAVTLAGEFLDDLDAYLSVRAGEGVRSLADVVEFNRDHADLELAHFGQEHFERALALGGRAAPEYVAARARNVTWALEACLGPAFADGTDVLVSPAYRPAWKSDLTHGDVIMGGGDVCTPPAILGWPILTIPMGLVDGLPVGLSIVGRAGSEPSLLAVGQALQDALGLADSGGLEPTWRPPSRG